MAFVPDGLNASKLRAKKIPIRRFYEYSYVFNKVKERAESKFVVKIGRLAAGAAALR
jgi:hypothetical protein